MTVIMYDSDYVKLTDDYSNSFIWKEQHVTYNQRAELFPIGIRSDLKSSAQFLR